MGYRRAIALLCLAYFLSMVATYAVPRSHTVLLVLLPIMGASGGLFALFTMYLPPLFPALLRTTGAGFCYNIGRIAAAVGTVVFGLFTQGRRLPDRPDLRGLALLAGDDHCLVAARAFRPRRRCDRLRSLQTDVVDDDNLCRRRRMPGQRGNLPGRSPVRGKGVHRCERANPRAEGGADRARRRSGWVRRR